MHKTIEHEADIGILGSGETWEKAFAEGALAMLGIMADIEKVEPAQEVGIQAQANDRDALFVEFLNELLFLRDAEDLFLSKFELRIEGNSLAGKAWGEKIDQKKHGVKIEVKAATYSGLKTWEEKGKKFVQCVVDV
ncbi:MAG: archease [Candidatus Diapherotrites archaeon]|nr:archease [Candidatus Diapherotrites archaeon]